MRTKAIFRHVVLASLLVSVIAVGGVVAQSANESGNTTTPNPSTPAMDTNGTGPGPDFPTSNATGNNTTSNSTGGSGGGGPLSGITSTVSNVAQSAAQKAIGPVLNFIVGVPQINIGWDTGSYHAPTNWPYEALFPTFYVGFALPLTLLVYVTVSFGSFASLSLSAFNMAPTNVHKASSRGARAILAIVVGIASHLLLTSLLHEVVAGWTQAIAPSPEELTSGMGLLKLGVGAAAIATAMFEVGWDVVKWVIILHGAVWLILVFFPMVSMPVFTTWIYAPRSGLGNFCGNIMASYFALLLSKVITAALLRMAFELDWSANFQGIVSAGLSLAMLCIVLAVPPATLVMVLSSKSRVMTAAVSAGAGAAAGSTVAKKGKELKNSDRVQDSKDDLKRAGSTYSKRGGAKAQGAWWDAKSRVRAAKSMSRGDAISAGKERVRHAWGTSGTNGEQTQAQVVRNMKESNRQSAAGASIIDRKNYRETQSRPEDD